MTIAIIVHLGVTGDPNSWDPYEVKRLKFGIVSGKVVFL